MNVQSAQIDPDSLEGFVPDPAPSEEETIAALGPAAAQVQERLSRAERPVILAGSGIRLAGAEKEFLDLVERLGIPVVTGFNAHDLVGQDHPCYIGRQGTIGDRAGNFAVQNSDVLLVVGCRLTIRQVSYNWENFAREAFKIMVDMDDAELREAHDQNRFADPCRREGFHQGAGAVDSVTLTRRFAPASPITGGRSSRSPLEGEGRARGRASPLRSVARLVPRTEDERYPVVLPEYWSDDSKGINPYCFVDAALFRHLPDDAIVVTGDGTACITAFQAAALKPGQRLYSDGGNAPMGFDLPGAIGAAVGSGRKPVVCLAGDGSIQMNIQELQTIATNRLPITIFVLNNGGLPVDPAHPAELLPGQSRRHRPPERRGHPRLREDRRSLRLPVHAL